MTPNLSAAREGTQSARPLAPAAPAPYLSVVVPVWNAAGQLARSIRALYTLLDAQPYSSELILVDDHSDSATVRGLRALHRERPVTVLRNSRNRGKGFSVARGMLAARGAVRVFTDADLAYSAAGVENVVDALERGHDVAVACRVLRESRYTMSPTFFPYLFTRHVLSRSFNAAVRSLLVPGVLDTQAGLKGFTQRAAELIFPRLTVERFGFDVESLYIARRHGLRIAQVAVAFRYDEEPSSVHLIREGVRMLADLGRIRANAWRGRYD